MATWADVERLALAMPEVTEDRGTWRVRTRSLVWERPLRPRDVEELGDRAPTGPVLGARVADENEKHALIAADPDAFFTTAHFDGYPAVLVDLDRISVDALHDLITDAWLDRAPKRVVKAYLAEHEGTE